MNRIKAFRRFDCHCQIVPTLQIQPILRRIRKIAGQPKCEFSGDRCSAFHHFAKPPEIYAQVSCDFVCRQPVFRKEFFAQNLARMDRGIRKELHIHLSVVVTYLDIKRIAI